MKSSPPANAQRKGHEAARGFTLIELLTVLALIATLAAFFVHGSGTNTSLNSLRAAQAAVANLITVARMRASASGASTRVVLHIDESNLAQPRRYLCYFVAQQRTAVSWETIIDCRLPNGVFVVPGNFSTTPAGLFYPSATTWVRNDGITALRSTALRSSMITVEAIESDVAESWVSINFAAVGSTAQSGDVVLTFGEDRPPGSWVAGEAPIELRNPDAVCGLTLSSYGITALIENRGSF